MESLQTQIEFYRLKDHKIPKIDDLSESELETVLITLQDADYAQFKKSMDLVQPLFLKIPGVFGPGEKTADSIRSIIITDVLANPDNYEIMNYGSGISQYNICLSEIHRIKYLYALSLMNQYSTLGDAFDSDDYGRYVRLMRLIDIYVEQYKLLTPNILKRIHDSGEYAEIFLDPDVVAIMNQIKEANINLRPISLQNDAELKTSFKESLSDLKSMINELRQEYNNHDSQPILVNNELTGLQESLKTSLDELKQVCDKNENCRIM